jgi:hypothetical protein
VTLLGFTGANSSQSLLVICTINENSEGSCPTLQVRRRKKRHVLRYPSSGPVSCPQRLPLCRTATAKNLPKGLRPLAPARVSPVFRTALRSVCADQGAFHSRCAPLQALGDSPPLALATPAGVGLGQGVVV